MSKNKLDETDTSIWFTILNIVLLYTPRLIEMVYKKMKSKKIPDPSTPHCDDHDDTKGDK